MILTAVFAVIIIYLFAICGYLFIQDDFLMEVHSKPLGIERENRTNPLSKCLATTIVLTLAFPVCISCASVWIMKVKERNPAPLSLCFQLLDVIFRDATLLQVTQSVTRNGKSILLTMMLALILIYLFSLLGFTFFRDDFVSHVQTTSRSPYSSSRYRRSTSTTASTATLTRRSTRRCRRLLSLFIIP